MKAPTIRAFVSAGALILAAVGAGVAVATVMPPSETATSVSPEAIVVTPPADPTGSGALISQQRGFGLIVDSITPSAEPESRWAFSTQAEAASTATTTGGIVVLGASSVATIEPEAPGDTRTASAAGAAPATKPSTTARTTRPQATPAKASTTSATGTTTRPRTTSIRPAGASTSAKPASSRPVASGPAIPGPAKPGPTKTDPTKTDPPTSRASQPTGSVSQPASTSDRATASSSNAPRSTSRSSTTTSTRSSSQSTTSTSSAASELPAACSAPEWNSRAHYRPGDQVTYRGAAYAARGWADFIPPGSRWSGWTYIADCR